MKRFQQGKQYGTRGVMHAIFLTMMAVFYQNVTRYINDEKKIDQFNSLQFHMLSIERYRMRRPSSLPKYWL